MTETEATDSPITQQERMAAITRQAEQIAAYPADAQRALAAILRAMGQAHKTADADTQQALVDAGQRVRELAARIGVQHELMATLYDMATTSQQQRDHAVDALTTLNTAIKRRDVNHPVIMSLYSDMYEDVMNDHNEAFWMSLPYDLGNMLGWSHTEAQELYDAITFDDMEEDPSDYGWSEAALERFRQQLRTLIQQLRDSEDDDD